MLRVKWLLSAALLAALVGQARAESDDVGLQIANFVFILFLVMLSALFSGLTLGLLGLDTNQLRVSNVSTRSLLQCPHFELSRLSWKRAL